MTLILMYQINEFTDGVHFLKGLGRGAEIGQGEWGKWGQGEGIIYKA